MARDLAVRVDNLQQLRKNLRDVDRGALREIQQVTKRAAGIVAEEARGIAPRRTGRLAKSIRATTSGSLGVVRSPLPYAPIIEYGWPARGIPDRRFIGRALENKQDAVLRELERGFDAVAKRNGF